MNIILQAYLDNALPKRGVWEYKPEGAEAHLSNVVEYYQALMLSSYTPSEFAKELWQVSRNTSQYARSALSAMQDHIPTEYYEEALDFINSNSSK